MPRYVIDSEATSFALSFRPHLPGFGMRIGAVTGEIEATFVDGRPDLDATLEGSFRAVVDQIVLGPRIVERTARRVIGRGDEIVTEGRLGNIAPHRDGYRLDLHLGMPWGEFAIASVGRVDADPTERVRVTGRTEVHPRQVGVPIPRVVPMPTTVAVWDLALTRAP